MNETEAYLLLYNLVASIAHRYNNSRAIKSDPSIDADDLFQEASIAFLRAIRTYDGRNKLTTYYYRVGHNHMTSYVRRQGAGRRRNTEEEFQHVPLESAIHIPARDLIGEFEDSRAFEQVIDDVLEGREAQFVKLRFGINTGKDGMSAADIAETAGVSRQMVDRVLQRALSRPEFIKALQSITGVDDA